MQENKFERYDPEIHDPILRCDAVVANGPCPYNKLTGSNYCPMHSAHSLQNKAGEQIRGYRLAQWKNRVGELADSPDIKNLNEEIGVMRLLLETMVQQCKTSTDLIMYSQRIAGTIASIEKLVCSFDRLETKMGSMLNKTAILQFAGTVVEIITKYVDDPEIIEHISEDIAKTLDTTRNDK
jgi:hypothetical protein